MEHLLSFEEFVNHLEEHTANQNAKDRRQVLANIKKEQYAIVLTFENIEGVDVLLEHEKYKQFKKTTNRYSYHPENPDIPVNSHYHVYPSNSKKELYAVNVLDGTAHHRVNRGHQVPGKEADELRSLGVNLPPDNILEAIDYTLNESIEGELLTVYIILDVE